VTGYTLLRARKGQGKALHQALTPMLRQVGSHPRSHNRHVQGQNLIRLPLFNVFALFACAFQVRAEQGCVNYNLYTPGPNNTNEEAVLFIETW
jgi:hypothetical protein